MIKPMDLPNFQQERKTQTNPIKWYCIIRQETFETIQMTPNLPLLMVWIRTRMVLVAIVVESRRLEKRIRAFSSGGRSETKEILACISRKNRLGRRRRQSLNQKHLKVKTFIIFLHKFRFCLFKNCIVNSHPYLLHLFVLNKQIQAFFFVTSRLSRSSVQKGRTTCLY